MVRKLTPLLLLLLPIQAYCADTRDVIIDHDGDVDDLIAMALLVKSPSVRVKAVVVCPGDSYLEPATRLTRLFLDKLGATGIPIAQGHNEGTNPFPAKWRSDASRVLRVRALQGATPTNPNPVVPEDAAHLIAKVLSTGTFTILETGPLTNIADALRLNPSLKKHISRIFIMGGAVRVNGNVEQKGHDGTAEWNFFNEPKAAAEVIASGIPITLISLDATNKTPLTRPFLSKLAAQQSVISQLAAQSWQLVVGLMGNEQYYFWDTLTAAALLDPSVVKTERLKIRVITTGASQGRSIEDPGGFPVDVAVDTDRQKVEQMFLSVLGK